MEAKIKTLLLIMGEIASGKDALASLIKEFVLSHKKVRGEIYSTTAKLDEILKDQGFELNRHNRQQLAIKLEKNDPNAFVNLLSEDMEHYDGELAIINSVRSENQILQWRKQATNCYMIYTDVDKETRLHRYNKRLGDGEPKLSPNEFQKLHSAKTDHDLQRLKRMADFRVDNNGALDELAKQVADIVHQVYLN